MKRNQAVALGLAAIAVAVLYFRCGSDRAADGTAPTSAPSGSGAGSAKLSKMQLKAQREISEIPLELAPDPLGELALQGRVLDEYGAAVAGSLVSISSAPPHVVQSNAEGAFELTGLSPRRYELVARKGDGFAQLAVQLDDSTSVTLRLRRAGVLAVTVVEGAAKRPVAGAVVELRDSSDASGAAILRATADAAGVATLRAVPGGSYVLYAAAAPHAPSWQALQLAERPGEIERITVELRSGVAVTGRVVDSRGAPVAGARVTAEDAGALVPLTQLDRDFVETDARGAFRIAALLAGTYRFVARSAAHAPSSSAPLRISTSAPAEVTITMAAGGRLAGRVVETGGEPVPFATVRVAVDGGAWGQASARQITSGQDGAFELTGLPRQRLAAVAASGSSTSLTRTFDLAQGDALDAVLALDSDGAIAGVVQDPEGRPIVEAVVFAEPHAAMARTRTESTVRGVLSAVTGGRGRFELQGLPAGKYALRASWPGASPRQRTQRLRPVVVAATGATDVVLELAADGVVRGHVQRQDGQRPAHFLVTLGGGASFGGRDGEFIITNVPVGTHSLRVSGPDFETRVLEGIELTSGERRDLGKITVVSGRRISGRVLAADGSPAAGATVVVTRQVTGVVAGPAGALVADLKQTTSGDDGSYALEGLTGSAVALAAENASGRSSLLLVAAGQEDQVLDLTLAGVGGLEGTVRRGGEPLPGAVVVMSAKGAPSGGSGVTTGTDGSYQFSALTPGAYTLMVMFDNGDGPQLKRVELQVTSGQTAKRDVELPRGSVTLVVTAEAGGAPGGAEVQALLTRQAQAPGEAGAGDRRSQPLSGSAPARFTELVPGSYQLCAVAAKPANGPQPAPVCKYVGVAEAPSEQQATIALPSASPATPAAPAPAAP